MAENFNRNSVKLSSTSVTDAYQAPNSAATDRAIILSCVVANVDGGSAADITISITDQSNTELSRLAYAISVPAKSSLEIIANKVILKNGEKLRATASAANDLDVTVSAVEITS